MRKGNSKVALLIGAGIILFTLFQYYSKIEVNKFTGKKQHISLSTEEEITIGIQIAPQMAQHFGGLYPDQNFQKLIDKVGRKLVNHSFVQQAPYKFDFHLLNDAKIMNAFALPGGQIFITYALFSILEGEDELAAILSHEIGHVLGRHSTERMEKQLLAQGILNGVDFEFVPNEDKDAIDIAYFLKMNYSLNEELESDKLSIKIMMESGCNPNALINILEKLKTITEPHKTPKRMSSHPNPENRIEKINDVIEKFKK